MSGTNNNAYYMVSAGQSTPYLYLGYTWVAVSPVAVGQGDIATHEEVVGTAVGTTVNSGGWETVYGGGTAISTTLNNGGNEYVYGSSSAISTTVNSGGTENVYNLGSAISTTVNSGGTENVFAYLDGYNGGSAIRTTVNNGGTVDVFRGGTTSFTTVSSGGTEYVHSVGTVIDTTVSSGGTEDVFQAGTASFTTVSSGGTEYVYSGGTAIDTTVSSGGTAIVSAGGLEIVSAGSATSVTVSSGGTEVISSGGQASDTILNSGGTIDVTYLPYISDGSASLKSTTDLLTVSEGGQTYTQKLSGDYTSVFFDLTADGNGGTDITNTSGRLWSTDPLRVTLQSGGDWSAPDGNGDSTYTGTVNIGLDGGEDVVEVVGATVDREQNELVFSAGATAYSLIPGNFVPILQGPFDVPYAVASGITVNSGGYEYVYANDAAIATAVNAGTSELYFDTASGATVKAGGTEYVYSGATASFTTVSAGALQTVYSGATAVSTTVDSGGSFALVSSGAKAVSATVNSGGTEYVYSGGATSFTTVNSSGTEHAYYGGSAISTTVNNGGTEDVSHKGAAISATVKGGGIENVRASGTTTGTTVSYGGDEYVHSAGSVDFTTLSSGGTEYVYSGGTAISTTVSNGGHEVVSSGGTTTGITLHSGGPEDVHQSGTTSFTTVYNGGNEYVDLGGTVVSTTVSSGGAEYVYSSATASFTTVSSGGYEYVSVAGTAISTTVSSGGFEVVSSGGTAISTTVSSGGYEVLSGGTTSFTTVSSGGILSGHGLVDGPIENDGQIIAGGGTLVIDGAVNGSGTLEVLSGATLEVGGTLADAVSDNFLGAGDLELDSPLLPGDTLDITDGGTLELSGSVTSTDTISFDGAGTLEIDGSTGVTPTSDPTEQAIIAPDGVTQDSIINAGSTIIGYNGIVITNFGTDDVIDFKGQPTLTLSAIFTGTLTNEVDLYSGSKLMDMLSFPAAFNWTSLEPQLDGNGGTEIIIDSSDTQPFEPTGNLVDWNFIHTWEGGSLLNPYIPPSNGSVAANGTGNLSGITVATGVDLGGGLISKTQFAQTFSSWNWASNPNLSFLDLAIGKTGTSAVTYLQTGTTQGTLPGSNLESLSVSITTSQATALTNEAEQLTFTKLVAAYQKASGQNWSAVPAGAQTAIMDMAYNFGLSKLESYNFWYEVTEQVWEEATEELRTWGGPANLLTRRFADWSEMITIPGVGTIVPADVISPSAINGPIASYSFSETIGTQYALDPSGLDTFTLSESADSPNFGSIQLPASDADSYVVSYEIGTTWSTPQIAQPDQTLIFPAGVDGIQVTLLDVNGDVETTPSNFTFYTTFAASGTFTGQVSADSPLTATWTGPTSADWNTPADWSIEAAPSSSTIDVLISQPGDFIVSISTGESFSVGAVTLAGTSGTTGALAVNGAGSELNALGGMDVGLGGSGGLSIENQATAVIGDGTFGLGFDVGTQEGASGAVTVSGTGSLLENTGGFIVGDGGLGSLAIESGATVMTTPGTVAVLAGGVIASQSGAGGSSVNVTGTGSNLQVSGALDIGSADTGVLAITNGATVSATTLDAGVGASGAGVVTVSGPDADLITTGTVTVGDAGSGELSILNGANATIGGDLNIANAGTGTGNVDIEDTTGTITFGGNVVVGVNGFGVFNIGFGVDYIQNSGGIIFGPDSSGAINSFADPSPFFSNSAPTPIGLGGTGVDQLAAYLFNSGELTIPNNHALTFETPIIYGGGSFSLGSGDNMVLNVGTVSAQTFTLGSNDTLTIGIDNLATIDVPPSGTSGFTPEANPNKGDLLLGSFGGVIANFTSGDTIAVDTHLASASAGTLSQNGAVVSVIEIANGATLGTLTFDNATNAAAAVADQAIMLVSVPCFAAGTRIATARGEVAVEAIEVGERVRVLLGGAGDGFSEVIWVGRREVDCAAHAQPRKVWPVRVAAGAFGPGRPHSDLFLSPDHAVYVNEVLIPIKHLINGSTIVQVPVERVTYHHIELAEHNVLLAEGLPAESFLDMRDGSNYANRPAPIRLYPDFSVRMWEAFGCARLVVAGPELAAARALVAGCAPAQEAALALVMPRTQIYGHAPTESAII